MLFALCTLSSAVAAKTKKGYDDDDDDFDAVDVINLFLFIFGGGPEEVALRLAILLTVVALCVVGFFFFHMLCTFELRDYALLGCALTVAAVLFHITLDTLIIGALCALVASLLLLAAHFIHRAVPHEFLRGMTFAHSAYEFSTNAHKYR